MKNIEIVSKVVSREGEAKHSPSKDISSANLSDYLLKSIWDKVWEIRTDSQGTEYIFGKLPVVTQYGITMYSGDGVDVPSLASGLPFDGRTIWYNPDTNQIEVIGGNGGGSGEGVSNFWDLSGIPSWITNSKPKYTYSEIEGTPDLTQYALVSQIPSLSGYATESWVLQKNYAIKATTLSGYGITDAYTKTNVDDLLLAYVTLGGKQTITGEKNFTGGLKVNGSLIYYDTEKKHWKLEGDLLVTGGVTMYGSDSSFTPSTIMDALLYDDTTLGINSNGQLYVKGGAGGGINTTDLQNYLTQNSYLNVADGDDRYLKLIGGTLSNTLTISNYNVGLILYRSGKTTPHMRFGENANNEYGEIGVYNDGSLVYWPLVSTQGGYGKWNTVWHEGIFKPSDYLKLKGGQIEDGATGTPLRLNSIGVEVGIGFGINGSYNGWVGYDTIEGTYLYNYATKDKLGIKDDGSLCYTKGTIWHSGNDGSGSGLDADTLDGYHANSSENKPWGTIPVVNSSGWMEIGKQLEFHYDNTTNSDYSTLLKCTGNYSNVVNLPSSSGTIALTTDNVSSATKLQTARTIWGQSFDGTGNVDGHMLLKGQYVEITLQGTNTYNTGITFNDYEGNPRWYLSYRGLNAADKDFYIYRYTDDNSYHVAMSLIRSTGNVGIGTTSPAYKLDVNGTIRFSSKTIWGRSFDGTSNVSGSIKLDDGELLMTSSNNWGTSAWRLFSYGPTLQILYGDGYSTASNTSAKFNNDGSINVNKLITYEGVNSRYSVFDANGLSCYTTSTGGYAVGLGIYAYDGSFSYSIINAYGSGSTLNYIFIGGTYNNPWVKIDTSANMLVKGGITMYSDQRKKTILNHVELSLKQIAEAPLIEHYYNGDEKKTTHVGSIAQYWASINDWFCKLDNEGYYTMEIQNAALASAISIARELDKYETKTDKAIKKLKKRICELEEEVERLKSE